MDALLISLMMTLPIIAVGAALYLWVRRAPTPEHAVRRKRILAGAVGVIFLLAMLWEPFRESRWYRYLNGSSLVEFDNDRGVLLHDVEVVVRVVGDNEVHTNRLGTMARGSRHTTKYRSGSDLVLERVSCLLNGRQLIFTNTAVATRGDLLRIQIDAAGQLLTGRK